MTVVGGGELFTGNTAVVTAAVIEGKASTGGLLKNWVFSYMGNFVGCVESLKYATAVLVVGSMRTSITNLSLYRSTIRVRGGDTILLCGGHADSPLTGSG